MAVRDRQVYGRVPRSHYHQGHRRPQAQDDCRVPERRHRPHQRFSLQVQPLLASFVRLVLRYTNPSLTRPSQWRVLRQSSRNPSRPERRSVLPYLRRGESRSAPRPTRPSARSQAGQSRRPYRHQRLPQGSIERLADHGRARSSSQGTGVRRGAGACQTQGWKGELSSLVPQRRD